MKRTFTILVMLLLAALPPALALAAEAEHEHQAMGASALDPLKQLAGDWVGKGGAGDEQMDAAVTYRVTANGSAVMETLFPGTPHEMITMYTLEKGAVVLTHYCSMGNQPHMRAKAGTPANELMFEFVPGAGINPAKDSHMHSASYKFIDADHIHSEWSDWEKGKLAQVMKFDMERKK
ncbi:MAG: hypothetical protein HY216_00710 [Candidatus Rokubacteria bacterium]|nr:hypothetical protein [Candidatus Rokubacteria bacterium]